jgi:hypothetical protein
MFQQPQPHEIFQQAKEKKKARPKPQRHAEKQEKAEEKIIRR